MRCSVGVAARPCHGVRLERAIRRIKTWNATENISLFLLVPVVRSVVLLSSSDSVLGVVDGADVKNPPSPPPPSKSSSPASQINNRGIDLLQYYKY